MKEAFERMTGMPDAWTNPALMQARNGFIQGWEARAQHDVDATIIQYHEATIKRLEKRIEELAQPAQEPVSVTYKEVADAMNSLWNGTLEQHQIAEQMANKKLYTTPPAAQPAQEPVAWMDEEEKIIYWHNTHETDDYHGFRRTTPLYTAPPQRTWVGMTLEERVEVWIICGKPTLKEWVDTVTAIEAKLKELNT